MQLNKKYPSLEGMCKVAIEKGLCTGCNRLELKDFKGLEECKIFHKIKYNKVEKGIQLKLEN